MDDPDLALDDEFGRHFGPGQFRHERQGPDTRVKVGEGRFAVKLGSLEFSNRLGVCAPDLGHQRRAGKSHLMLAVRRELVVAPLHVAPDGAFVHAEPLGHFVNRKPKNDELLDLFAPLDPF